MRSGVKCHTPGVQHGTGLTEGKGLRDLRFRVGGGGV